MCTASAVSATRIRKKICGPWLDEGPKEDESIEAVSVDPYTALPGVEAPVFWLGILSFSGFFDPVLDGRR